MTPNLVMLCVNIHTVPDPRGKSPHSTTTKLYTRLRSLIHDASATFDSQFHEHLQKAVMLSPRGSKGPAAGFRALQPQQLSDLRPSRLTSAVNYATGLVAAELDRRWDLRARSQTLARLPLALSTKEKEEKVPDHSFPLQRGSGLEYATHHPPFLLALGVPSSPFKKCQTQQDTSHTNRAMTPGHTCTSPCACVCGGIAMGLSPLPAHAACGTSLLLL